MTWFYQFIAYEVTVATKVFRHSAQEKKEYVKDFIKAIGLTKWVLAILY